MTIQLHNAFYNAAEPNVLHVGLVETDELGRKIDGPFAIPVQLTAAEISIIETIADRANTAQTAVITKAKADVADGKQPTALRADTVAVPVAEVEE